MFGTYDFHDVYNFLSDGCVFIIENYIKEVRRRRRRGCEYVKNSHGG